MTTKLVKLNVPEALYAQLKARCEELHQASGVKITVPDLTTLLALQALNDHCLICGHGTAKGQKRANLVPSCDLQISGKVNLTFRLERIHKSAYFEDVSGYCISGGMVGTHSSGGVGNADSLDSSRVISGQTLSLYYWYMRNPKSLSGNSSPTAQYSAQWATLTDFVE